MKKLNNKGFSLVELIIVIAIMAILVGILAPSLMKYIEKSRVASDTQTVDNLYSALKYAMADEEAYAEAPVAQTDAATILNDTGNKMPHFSAEVVDIFGAKDIKFKSKGLKGVSANKVIVTPVSGDFVVSVSAGDVDITIPKK